MSLCGFRNCNWGLHLNNKPSPKVELYRTPWINAQCWSMMINDDQSRSKSWHWFEISFNADQCWSALIGIGHWSRGPLNSIQVMDTPKSKRCNLHIHVLHCIIPCVICFRCGRNPKYNPPGVYTRVPDYLDWLYDAIDRYGGVSQNWTGFFHKGTGTWGGPSYWKFMCLSVWLLGLFTWKTFIWLQIILELYR